MFILNGNDETPLYKQLYSQIRERVLSGKLAANSKLPSVRDLAEELAISRNTVEGAYQELYAEGYIYSRSRSGYFVSALHPEAAPLKVSRKFSQQCQQVEPPISYPFDFHPALLDGHSFPIAVWRKCLLEALRDSTPNLSHYCHPQGEWRLRSAIQKYLEHSRGVVCDPEQIVICAGLQQSLNMVAMLLQDTNRTVAVENPGYHLPRAVFKNHSYDLIPVPVTSHGLDTEALKASDATIAYVTPSHQLPMGYVMPVANRLRLIEWAESGRFILEDDYDSELRYYGKPIASLQGLRPDGNIIYLGTFSKVLSPALRVSYLLLPLSLVAKYRSLFQDYFSTVSLFEQLTLATFMEQGHWERHVRRMRTIYKKKHDALLDSVERNFGARAQVVGEGAGLHVVLQLDGSHTDEPGLIARAGEKGIRLIPFSVMRATDDDDSLKVLLGFGGMTVSEIDQGVAELSRLCR